MALNNPAHSSLKMTARILCLWNPFERFFSPLSSVNAETWHKQTTGELRNRSWEGSKADTVLGIKRMDDLSGDGSGSGHQSRQNSISPDVSKGHGRSHSGDANCHPIITGDSPPCEIIRRLGKYTEERYIGIKNIAKGYWAPRVQSVHHTHKRTLALLGAKAEIWHFRSRQFQSHLIVLKMKNKINPRVQLTVNRGPIEENLKFLNC